MVLAAQHQLKISPGLVKDTAALALLLTGAAVLEVLEKITDADKLQMLASALVTICRERCGCSLAGRGVQGAC